MSIGYGVGGQVEESDEISVANDWDENVITYSPALPVIISRACQNKCSYCSFQKKDSLTIPYSIIRATKDAKLHRIREAYYIAGERPDTFPHVRSLLELWGFDTYLDYLYTIAELAFLEGLIPVLEVGFLSPKELKKMQEVTAVAKIMLDSINPKDSLKLHPKSPGKNWDIRLKQIEWASKLKLPVATGLLVGIGELKGHRKEALKEIARLHKQYGMIHEVSIQNFVPQAGTLLSDKAPASKDLHLETVELARGILPDDITLSVPYETTQQLGDFIKAGVRDLGRLFSNPAPYINPVKSAPGPAPFEDLVTLVEKEGLSLGQRFPLKKSFIKAGNYSKKLGQVFDNYKYKLKKESQEKSKSKEQ